MRRTTKILSLLCLAVAEAAHSYQGPTHKVINEAAITLLKNTAGSIGGTPGGGLDIDQLLKSAAWATSGLGTNLGTHSALGWLLEGAAAEDIPFLRCLNHFYDPWVADFWSLNTDDDGGLWGNGNAAEWALRYQSTGAIASFAYGEDSSWPAAQDYYYTGLTGFEPWGGRLVGPKGNTALDGYGPMA